MPSSLDADRAELLELLCRDGIFRSSDEHPILAHDGTKRGWMLDSLRVSLTARGAELSARCLLALVERFDGRQLATYGVTAIPLLQACVALSGGRYRGLVVRKEKKAHGSRKLIEGPFDLDEPVIFLDDSVSSGSSMVAGVNKLEEAGFRVEGGVCLVRFGWYGGCARMQERGLRMEHVFDVHEDLVPIVEPTRPRLPYNASDLMPAFTWADQAADDGMHPAILARDVMERFLRGEPVPRPPRRFDRDYDAAGGCFVSVRSRANQHVRHARDGLWVFPRDTRREPGEDLIRAAVRTAAGIKTPGALAESAVAVTFFGALEECTVGQLDNDRYGIVVRSAERVEKLGGALPRMPGMSREWAQFEHARKKNAKLYGFEPYVLFRHTVDKAVEPGEAWQPTGMPKDTTPTWRDDPARAGRVAARAFDLACASISGRATTTEPVPDDLIGPTDAVFVSIYLGGRVAGCIGGKMTRLDDDLRRTTEQALADKRFATVYTPDRVGEIAVTVSFLDDATPMGPQFFEDISIRYRHGEQALTVFQNTRNALLLPFVVVQQSLSPSQYVAELVDKAGITRAPYQWGRYDVVTWLADRDPPRRLVWGLPPGEPPATLAASIEMLTPLFVAYLLRHTRPDGLRDGFYRPFHDQVVGELDRPRQVHGAWTLARAHRVLGDERLGTAAHAALAALAGAEADPVLVEAAFLLLTRCELGMLGDPAAALAARLCGAIDRHGGIGVEATPPTGTPAEIELEQRRREAVQDYLPAQVLLALATAAQHGLDSDRAVIDRAFRMCRHRFRGKHGWGQVGWLPQAAAAWWQVTRDPAMTALAFEVVDWALESQQETSGGFINGEQPDAPGYSTGVYLEGVAAALGLAIATGDADRAARYRASAAAALRFLDVIVYQERDRPLLPAPERAFGGVRISRTAGDVRIDFVQHALNAVLLLRSDPAPPAVHVRHRG